MAKRVQELQRKFDHLMELVFAEADAEALDISALKGRLSSELCTKAGLTSDESAEVRSKFGSFVWRARQNGTLTSEGRLTGMRYRLGEANQSTGAIKSPPVSAQNEKPLSADAKKMLGELPADGRAIGNTALSKILNWLPNRYSAARKELLDTGLATIGRGRGGSLRRTTPEKVLLVSRPATRIREQDLYPRFRKALENWASGRGWRDFFVVSRPNQGGGKKGGGTWTRPDFVVAGYQCYEYTQGVVRDIETFEVKTAEGLRIEAVFETASHSRCATKSYLAVLKSDDSEIDEDLRNRVQDECERFGVGLVFFPPSDDPTKWDWRVDPERNEPDPALLEEYIRTQWKKDEQERLRGWLRIR